MLHFTVVGLGAVGATVVSLLNDSFHNCIINIMDPSPHVHGRYLDLAHAAAAHNNTLSINEAELFAASDCVVYCAGVRNAKDADRSSVVQQNKSLVKKIFHGIQFSNNPLIINLVNPVEAISYWINETLGEKNTVVSTGTGLDSFRLKFLISDFFEIPQDKVKAVVLGEHGTQMVPIFSQTFMDNKVADTFLSDSEKHNLTKALIHAAKSIRSTEKATKYGVAEVAVQIARHYFTDIGSIELPLTVNTRNNNLIPFKKNIFFNLLTRVTFQNIKVIPIEIINNEKLALLEAKKSIEKTLSQ